MGSINKIGPILGAISTFLSICEEMTVPYEIAARTNLSQLCFSRIESISAHKSSLCKAAWVKWKLMGLISRKMKPISPSNESLSEARLNSARRVR